MEIEYAVSRTTTERSEPPGRVKSLSIAAFVDLSGIKVPEGGEPLTIERIEKAIRDAAGGEKIASLTVIDQPFVMMGAGDDLQEEDLMSPEFLLNVAKHLSLGILVMGVLAFLWLTRRKRLKYMTVREDQAGRGARALQGGSGENATDGGSASDRRALPSDPGDLSADALRDGISKALRENPEQVRRMFETWMTSDE